MGQKKVNKANDSFKLKQAKGQNNKKGIPSFASKFTNQPNRPST